MDEQGVSDSLANAQEQINDLDDPNLMEAIDDFNARFPADILEELNTLDVEELFSPPITTDYDDSPWIGQWSRFTELVPRADTDVKTQIDRYGREFLNILDFRRFFAEIIERKGWHRIEPSDDVLGSENMKLAKATVISLQEEVNNFLSNPNVQINFNERTRLQQWHRQLQNQYINQPMELVQVMLTMLRKEQSILIFAANRKEEASTITKQESQVERIQTIMNEISQLESSLQDSSQRLDRLHTEFQQLQIYTSGNIKALDAYNVQTLSSTDAKTYNYLCKLRESIINNKQLLVKAHQEQMRQQFQKLVLQIKQEILHWQRMQACANNGRTFPTTCDINHLEDCCNPLSKLLTKSLEQLVRLLHLEVDTVANESHMISVIEGLRQQYEDVTKDLIENTLVLEKQPPQVLMKDKKFVCQLRHLAGDGLSSHQFRFDTQVWLINMETARTLMEGDHIREIKPSGRIVNNTAKADFSDQTKQLLVHMRNMSLQMRQRGDRGRADCVAEEKFCMVFRSFISLRFPSNSEYNVVAQTMSLPIVVISHGKQEADAQATIFWDNAFSEQSRRPFEVTDTVPWHLLLSELDCLWKKNCREGPGSSPVRGLDDSARKYLTHKFLGRDDAASIVNVTWKQFNRDNLSGMGFTFWKWFFMVMELCSSVHVKKYWNAGLIKGFISKAACHILLKQRQLGTFLFRFSDSNLGAVSISCHTYNVNSGLEEVGHLEPDTISKLKSRSLPDIVKDLKFLHFLYPDLPKNSVFQSYYTPGYCIFTAFVNATVCY
ncbi:unnamed protein product [Clavelina lepadiformis]|uniref:Signal transducer and activator of transcription n=1 Tax=Clavelina lepadiformis TaxID=159417 RepID=A0ABP0GKD9_CLALP